MCGETPEVTYCSPKNPSYRYHPDRLYDRCVSHLFRDRLHKDQGYAVYFAKWGQAAKKGTPSDSADDDQ